MLDVDKILDIHQRAIDTWLRDPESLPEHDSVYALIVDEHHHNFTIWQHQNAARRTDLPDSAVVQAKRMIDKNNQQRNDLVEKIDDFLLEYLAVRNLADPAAPLQSETPGSMIDRLSVLALKIHYAQVEASRPNASPEDQRGHQQRHATLVEQRDDLAGCLRVLWEEVLAGQRRFKVYRQLKMYK